MKHVGLLSSLSVSLSVFIVSSHVDVTSWLLLMLIRKVFINIFSLHKLSAHFPHRLDARDGFVLLVNSFLLINTCQYPKFNFIHSVPSMAFESSRVCRKRPTVSLSILSTFFSPFAAAGVCRSSSQLLEISSFHPNPKPTYGGSRAYFSQIWCNRQ